MGGIAHQPPAAGIAAALQFQRENQHGQFALRIGLPGIEPPGPLQIVEMDRRLELVRHAAEADHARRDAGPQPRQKLGGECEMAQIIGAELQLEPILGFDPPGRQHHAGIVHQQVQRTVFGREGGREPRDGGQAGQIQIGVADGGAGVGRANAAQSRLPLCVAAAGEHHAGAGACQSERGFIAQPAGGAGNDGQAAGLGRDVADGPGHWGLRCGATPWGRLRQARRQGNARRPTLPTPTAT
jgi:hypothetical protein